MTARGAPAERQAPRDSDTRAGARQRQLRQRHPHPSCDSDSCDSLGPGGCDSDSRPHATAARLRHDSDSDNLSDSDKGGGMITPRHSYSDSDPETATRGAGADGAATAEAPEVTENAVSREGLTALWVSVMVLGGGGAVAGYLRHHRIGGWGAVLGVLGVALIQFVFFMVWYHVRRDFPTRAQIEQARAECAAPAEAPRRRPSPHPRGPAEQ